MKSNPYYIIQQGKINQILNCTDEEYFDIFCEAMGTKIYEEKKAESLKLLEENKATRAKIEQQSQEIQVHIDKLYEQCEDLKNYSAIELKRRGIEYFILHEQINELEVNIGFLQERHQADINQIKEVYQKQNITKNEINQKLKEIEKINENLEIFQKKVTKFNKIINQLESYKIQKESNLNNKKYNRKEAEKDLENYSNELEHLKMQREAAVKGLTSAKNGIEALEEELISKNRDGTRSTTSPHVRPDLRNLLKGMPFSHQSVIVRTDLMKKMGGFSADYPRSADYAFVMELVFAGKKAIHVERDFVTFRAGGFSSQNRSENQREHLVAFASLAKRYLGRELTAKEFKAYVYACILRTFGAAALRDGWNGAENDIAPLVARGYKEIARLDREVWSLKRSFAYRVGMFVTFPARKARGGVKCLRENGLKYTAKHAIGKVVRLFGSKCRW